MRSKIRQISDQENSNQGCMNDLVKEALLKKASTISSLRSNINIVDENMLENHFKQVEDSLMGLSKILSALYLATLSTSNLNQSSNINTININSNQSIINPVGLVVPSVSSAQQHFNSSFNTGHQHQPSSSVRF